MCEICRQIPCDSRCPAAPEIVPIHQCGICGEGIYEGDKYFQDGSSDICEECMDDISAEEMLKLFGESLKTA